VIGTEVSLILDRCFLDFLWLLFGERGSLVLVGGIDRRLDESRLVKGILLFFHRRELLLVIIEDSYHSGLSSDF